MVNPDIEKRRLVDALRCRSAKRRERIMNALPPEERRVWVEAIEAADAAQAYHVGIIGAADGM